MPQLPDEHYQSTFQDHVIVREDAMSLRLKRPGTVCCSVTIAVDDLGNLSVIGDIGGCIFGRGPRNLHSAISWMGSRSLRCGYALEKASIGMGGRQEVLTFDPEDFESDVKALFQEMLGDGYAKNEPAVQSKLCWSEFNNEHSLELDAQSRVEAYRAIVEYLEDLGLADAFEYVGDAGLSQSANMLFSLAALQKAYALLDERGVYAHRKVLTPGDLVCSELSPILSSQSAPGKPTEFVVPMYGSAACSRDPDLRPLSYSC